MRPALLVLDPQNDFFEAGNSNLAEFERAVLVINTAAALFREHNCPVVFVQHTSARKPPGSHEWGIYEGFDCNPDDARLNKTHQNAFEHSGLDLLLSSHDVTFVVLSGFELEHCVLASYHEALGRDYQAALLGGGIAGRDNARTDAVVRGCRMVTLEDLHALLAGKLSPSCNPCLPALIHVGDRIELEGSAMI